MARAIPIDDMRMGCLVVIKGCRRRAPFWESAISPIETDEETDLFHAPGTREWIRASFGAAWSVAVHGQPRHDRAMGLPATAAISL